ncbi:hypothetical protein Rsub_01710 [Raphidocelis subcapitata]|uniref:RRM domain-containing protein n=1 Tax=Raphidocelis subcapitata TaxID=307507 RepID=A0A2V0NNK9_9CHLO|nr:hypothetical protein Rsub_01710 [Raphidocelis subcapitata]|eukprot:GBF88809.1 hypothetical protein Rsub_01710 [Raphidocelis subcapitata]
MAAEAVAAEAAAAAGEEGEQEGPALAPAAQPADPVPPEAAGTAAGEDDAAAAAAAAAPAAGAPPPSPPRPDAPERGVLRLRGIPFAANEANIFEFFAGAENIQQPLEVYICRRNGRSTGECYVVLPTAEDAASARQQLDKRNIAHRYIEIFDASLPDLEAVRTILEESAPRGHCLRLRGLPFSAAAADVAAFLEGVALAEGPEAIVLTFTADGRPTGEAYVEVADEAAAAAAMAKHKERMGPRYIEVFASTKHDLLQAAQQAQFHQGQAVLRRRWAALGGGDGGGGAVGGGAAGGGAARGPAVHGGGGGGVGGGYGAPHYATLPAGGGGVDGLTQAFEGFGLRGMPQAPGAPYVMGPEMLMQYAGVPMGGPGGGMAVPYYVMEGAPMAGPMGGGPGGAAGGGRGPQGAQQGVPPQGGGLLLAGYSQQGPVYVPAGPMLPHQQAGPQLQAAAAAQAAGPYLQAVPLQQWPPQADAQQMAQGGWGYGGGMQPGALAAALPAHFLPQLGAPGQQQHDMQQPHDMHQQQQQQQQHQQQQQQQHYHHRHGHRG